MHVCIYALLPNAHKMHDEEYLLMKGRLRGPSTGKGRNRTGVLNSQ